MACSECGTDRLHASANFCPYVENGLTSRRFGIGAAALPNKGAPVVAIDSKEKRWERDGAAYKALRQQGYAVPSIDGAAEMSTRANCAEQIETAQVSRDREGKPKVKFLAESQTAFRAFEDAFERSATEPATKPLP